MVGRFGSSPHFHIRWLGKENLDWECFSTENEAKERATSLMFPGEAFTIEEVYMECPLRELMKANA